MLHKIVPEYSIYDSVHNDLKKFTLKEDPIVKGSAAWKSANAIKDKLNDSDIKIGPLQRTERPRKEFSTPKAGEQFYHLVFGRMPQIRGVAKLRYVTNIS